MKYDVAYMGCRLTYLAMILVHSKVQALGHVHSSAKTSSIQTLPRQSKDVQRNCYVIYVLMTLYIYIYIYQDDIQQKITIVTIPTEVQMLRLV